MVQASEKSKVSGSGSDLHFKIALTLIPSIGDVLAKNLVSYCGGVERIFKTRKKDLIKIPGIDEVRANSIIGFDDWKGVDEEVEFIVKNKIRVFFYLDEEYPWRMKSVSDAPVILFAKGNFDPNAEKIISIVGTRHATPYGKQFTENLIGELKEYGVTIVSGLAYGIDITAHKEAIKAGLPTIGVLAHGLNRLYPGHHRSTAVSMIENGGLLSEFKTGDAFEPQNFPKRNRIVAGIADATIVIESAIEGGALITATIANSYNREVLCVPGRAGDKFSAGCNYFLKSGKANLVENGDDVVNALGWTEHKRNSPAQRELFIELTENENKIVSILKKENELQVDAISNRTNLYGSQLAAALLNLEFKGVMVSLPGKIYRLS